MEQGSVYGDIFDGTMQINEYGQVVQNEWMKTADVRTNVELDEFVVMPNHIHGIIVLSDVGARRRLALPDREETDDLSKTDQNRATHRVAPTAVSGSVGAIVGQFKSIVTKHINRIRNTPDRPVWQRNYYEHVIRGDEDFNRIREYIINNPLQWAEDENNPVNIKCDITHCRGEALPRPESFEPGNRILTPTKAGRPTGSPLHDIAEDDH